MREPIRETPTEPTPQADAPSPQFIAQLAFYIRGGVTKAGVAAKSLGVPTRTFKLWMKRQGEPYETMRKEIAQAIAHLEVTLLNGIAKKSPSVALADLKTVPKDSSPDYLRYVARQAKKKPWELLGLSVAEEMFCRHLVCDPTENAANAVRKTGLWEVTTPQTVHNQASYLMNRPRIQARLSQLRSEALMMIERKTRTKVTTQRLMERLAAIALGDIRKIIILDEHGMSVRPIEEWPDEAAAAVKAIANTSEGVKVELHNPQFALELLTEIVKLRQGSTVTPIGVQIERAIVMIPDNGRDPHLRPALTNGAHSNGAHAHPEGSRAGAIIDIPANGADVRPADDGVDRRSDPEPDVVSEPPVARDGQQPDNRDDGPDELERDLGLA